jgi:hypothetical protein
MFAGDVYYCWSCDAHCRARLGSNEGPCCPRCQEHLSEDCRLDGGPRLISFLAINEQPQEREASSRSSPGLWPSRAAAMH